jgi:hypothetical protein
MAWCLLAGQKRDGTELALRRFSLGTFVAVRESRETRKGYAVAWHG